MVYVHCSEPWNTNSTHVPLVYQHRTVRDDGTTTPWLDIGAGPPRVRHTKQRPANGTAEKIDGWREPTVHRAYVSKVTPDEGMFQFFRADRPRKEYRGSCYAPWSHDLYTGMSGAGHYPIDHLSMSDRARTECLAKANRSDFQIGVAVAELATTVAHLGKTLTDLAKYMKAARNFLLKRNLRRSQVQMILRTTATKAGRRKIVKALGKQAASRWLEFQYGWKPLLSDLYGIAGLVEEQMNGTGLTVKSVANPSESAVPEVPFSAPPPGFSLVANEQIITGAKCRMDFRISNAAAATFNRLGLLNISEIMWELIPFSFVLDWVLPIGKWLAALSGGWGLTFRGGSITAYTFCTARYEWYQYVPLLSKKHVPNGFTLNSVTTFRYPISDITPRFYVTNPINSVSRVATALALLHTVLSKKG